MRTKKNNKKFRNTELLKNWERIKTAKERKGLQKYSGDIQLERGTESVNLIEENTRNFEIIIS